MSYAMASLALLTLRVCVTRPELRRINACGALVLAIAFACSLATARAGDAAPADREPSDSEQGAPFADSWRKTVVLSDQNAEGKASKCIAWVDQGWLVVERRDVSGDVEWQIVLAQVGPRDTPPLVEANPNVAGGLRLSYRNGRFFLRDDFGTLRCRRQIKTVDVKWPPLAIPKNEPQPGGSWGGREDRMHYYRINHDWHFVACGMKDERAEYVLRLSRFDLERYRGIGSVSGLGPVIHTRVAGPPESSDQFPPDETIIDDRELLIVRRDREVDAERKRAAREALEDDRKRLVGAAAPEISASGWLNSPRPLALKGFKDKVVLVYCADDNVGRAINDLKHIDGLYEKFRDRGFEVVGVVPANDAGYYSASLLYSGSKVPLALDDGATLERFLITSAPCCFLIDRDGKIAAGHYYGYRAPFPTPLPDGAEIEKLLKADEK